MCLCVVTVKCCFLSERKLNPWMDDLALSTSVKCADTPQTQHAMFECVRACERALRAFILT